MNRPEMPFPDVTQMMSQFKLPGVDMNAVMSSRRKDIEALVSANRHAYEGMQQLAQRQAEMFKEALSEWQSAAQDMMKASASSPAAGTAKQVELGQQAVQKALENMRELAEMAARSQTEAFNVVNRRFHESLEEIKSSMQQSR